MKKGNGSAWGGKFRDFSVPLLFVAICAVCIPLSGFSPGYLINEMITRIGRNTFLILCLLFPILAGMGLNFAMTLGAMSAQIALILVSDWQIWGIPGVVLAMLLGLLAAGAALPASAASSLSATAAITFPWSSVAVESIAPGDYAATMTVGTAQQLSPEIPQALPVDDEIRVVGDIAAGGPQVDDPRGGGGRLAVGVDVGHHVVADLLLPRRSRLIVDVGDVGLQLRHLLRGDGQAQIALGPGQGHPQPPPGLKAHVGGEQVQHERRGVPGRQRGFVTIFGHKWATFLLFQSLGGTATGASRGCSLFRRRRSIMKWEAC